MQTKIEIAATELRGGDTIHDTEGNLRTIADVDRHGGVIRGLYTGGFRFAFMDIDKVTVSLDIEVGKLYLWGNRSNDAEWRVVKVTEEANEEGFFGAFIAGDRSPTTLLKTFFICEATNEEIQALYLKYRGARCPYCRSTDMVGGDHNSDDNWHSTSIECNSCGATWDDVHTLSHINELQTPWDNE